MSRIWRSKVDFPALLPPTMAVTPGWVSSIGSAPWIWIEPIA